MHPRRPRVVRAREQRRRARRRAGGEAQGRIVVSTPEAADVLAIARRHGVPARQVGAVRAASRTLRIQVGARAIAAPLDGLSDAYHGAIPRIMSGSVAAAAVAEETFTPVP